MYELTNENWLPKPHSIKFVQDYLTDYRYTSSIIIALKGSKVVLAKVKSRGWDFVGGRVEGNETPLECAQREFKEESGLDIEGKFQFVGTHQIDCELNPKGNKTAQAIFVVKIDNIVSSDNPLEEDIEESRFFDINNLPFENATWKSTLINHMNWQVTKNEI